MAKAKKKANKSAAPKASSLKLPVVKVNKNTLTIAGVVVLLAVILFFFKSLFVAALVNGTPISRLAVVSELEKSNGQSVLDSLVTKELIRQEARKNKIVISKEEIDAEIAKVEETIKAQGQTLDDALAAQGWSRRDLEDQITTQKIVEKLLADQVQVSEEEIDAYIKENSSTEPRETVAEQLKQQKLFEAYQGWIQGIMAQAKINYWVKY